MRIRYQSAVEMNRAGDYSRALNAHFARVASPGTTIELNGAKPGTWGNLQPAKVSGFPWVFHRVVKDIFIDAALEAEREGYDAFIIGSSTDPGLREIRSLVDIPVITAMESSFLSACTIANRIGLIAPTAEAAYIVESNLKDYGLSHKIASWELIEPELADDELNMLFSAPAAFLERFVAIARNSINKGADAIIPAEGILAEVVATNGLTHIDGATVVDPIGVAILFAEMQVKLKQLTGFKPGRRWHYTQPPASVVKHILSRRP